MRIDAQTLSMLDMAAVMHCAGVAGALAPNALSRLQHGSTFAQAALTLPSPVAASELPELLLVPLLLPFPPPLLELELLLPLPPLEDPVPPPLELLLEDDSASSLPPPELLLPKPVLPPLLLEQPTTTERPATTITDTDLSIVTLRGGGSMSERARQGNTGATPSNPWADAGQDGGRGAGTLTGPATLTTPGCRARRWRNWQTH